MPDVYRGWDIRTTCAAAAGLQRSPPGLSARLSTGLCSHRPERLRSGTSNKSGFCHGVRTQNGNVKAIHVCDRLTPTRFLWLYEQYREREQIGGIANVVLQPMLSLLRRWDRAAAQRVDHFIAISTVVQERIRAIYGRESVVIHPPVHGTLTHQIRLCLWAITI